METNNNKIVMLYSNNSKKARLKRKKNKFQRIWDAEKQKYVKVRKTRYPVINSAKKELEDFEKQVKKLERRNKNKGNVKKQNKAAVVKMQQHAKENKVVTAPVVHTTKKATSVKMFGKVLEWDQKTMRYRKAA